MKNPTNVRRGFIALPILIAIVIGAIVAAGGVYVVTNRPEVIHQIRAKITGDVSTESGSINSADLATSSSETTSSTKASSTIPQIGDSHHEPGFVVNTFTTDSCPFITYSMVLGTTDSATQGQVTKLQDFLRLQNMYSKASTGNFDADTLAAVAKWQKYIGFANQIKNAGTVGEITRQHINALCKPKSYSLPIVEIGTPFVTPMGTPTIAPPLGWTSHVVTDEPLTPSNALSQRTLVVFSDSGRKRVVNYQLFAVQNTIDDASLQALIEDALSINANTTLYSQKAFNASGVGGSELQYSNTVHDLADNKEKTYQAVSRVFRIQGYVVILGASSEIESVAEIHYWYDPIFETIMLPAVFSAYPNGIPVNRYASAFSDLEKKAADLRTAPKGTASDFYLPTCYKITHDLFLGDRDLHTNGDVSNLQKLLFQKYTVSSSISGIFDDTLLLQVIRFQREMGFEGTGGVGAGTRDALNRCKTSN